MVVSSTLKHIAFFHFGEVPPGSESRVVLSSRTAAVGLKADVDGKMVEAAAGTSELDILSITIER